MVGLDVLKPKIGTRVYVVVPDKFVVVAALVVERLTKETQDGTSTSYILDFGQQGRERVHSDSVKDSVVVATREDAYTTLVSAAERRARRAVDVAAASGDQRLGRQVQQPAAVQQHQHMGPESLDTSILDSIAAEMNGEFEDSSRADERKRRSRNADGTFAAV